MSGFRFKRKAHIFVSSRSADDRLNHMVKICSFSGLLTAVSFGA